MRELFERLYTGKKADFFAHTEKTLESGKKLFVITANPEIFMMAEDSAEIKALFFGDHTSVIPDGIGLVRAARSLSLSVSERIPGVELAAHLLWAADKLEKSVFLYGAAPEVMDRLLGVAAEKYPGAKIAGAYHGYGGSDEEIAREIRQKEPDIVLAALGMPRQELFLSGCVRDMEKGIFVGVGGSFDVISGSKKRAPALFRKMNLEWLYRILKEPRRLKRFWNSNVRFLFRYKK